MKSALLLAFFLLMLASFCFGQSGTVVNAAGSLTSRPGVLAPVMLATINEAIPTLAILNPFPAPVVTAPRPGVTSGRVLIRPSGSTRLLPATVTSVTQSSVTFVVPADVPYGPAELVWQLGDEPFRSLNVTVAQSNFELSAGSRVIRADGTLSPVGFASPAQPGQTIALAGSGLGFGTAVTVRIAGAPAAVIYSGRGTAPGYDQIQLQVPATTPDGCYVPLALTVGQTVVSSYVSVTHDGSPCQHPFALSLTDLKTLDAGGTMATAEIDMNTALEVSLSSSAYRDESAGVTVMQMTAADLARYFVTAAPQGCSVNGASYGVFAFLLGGFVSASPPVVSNTLPPPPPTLGSSVTLQNGPNTLRLDASNDGADYYGALPPAEEGSLANPPASAIAPAKWIFVTPGSADVAPSSVAFALGPPLQIAGGAPVSLRRDQAQTIAWNGADFDNAATVTIFLNGHPVNGAGSRGITCSALARSGTFTIPAAFLSQFAGRSIGTLRVSASPSGAAMPHTLLTTKAGKTLVVTAVYSTADDREVDFQ